jgi:hypothetical protein
MVMVTKADSTEADYLKADYLKADYPKADSRFCVEALRGGSVSFSALQRALG